MNKILLIGNSGLSHHGTDGQTVKVRLYLKKMKDEGFDVAFVDLEQFPKHPFSILLKIKRLIKQCDRIVLITAERGCKILIPFINHFNRKLKKPFILPLVGTSVLHYSIDKLSETDKNDFIVNGNYSLCKPKKKLQKELSKITFILPETELLVRVFKTFYHLDNVKMLTNFRENIPFIKKDVCNLDNELKIVFVSRIMEIKGIFDLLKVVKLLKDEGKNISLDIYGPQYLSDDEKKIFTTYIRDKVAHCMGELKNDEVSNRITDYHLFVFPTHYMGEGTPGVIVESLLSGTAVLTADFPQAKHLLKDGFDSIFYEMNNVDDLKSKLEYIYNNRDILNKLNDNAILSGERFSYNYCKDSFLKLVCGVEDK